MYEANLFLEDCYKARRSLKEIDVLVISIQQSEQSVLGYNFLANGCFLIIPKANLFRCGGENEMLLGKHMCVFKVIPRIFKGFDCNSDENLPRTAIW